MIFEILAVGLIISAVLALFLDEVIYSVAALAGTFFFTAFLYVENGALYAAIFQIAVGVGTLAILFLSGEMLGDKPKMQTSPIRVGALVGAGAVLPARPAKSVLFRAARSAAGRRPGTLRGRDGPLQPDRAPPHAPWFR